MIEKKVPMELTYGSPFAPLPDSTEHLTVSQGQDIDDLHNYITESGIKLVDQTICSLQVAKNFHENTDPINSLDFARRGDLMVSAADDDQIIMYNCETGSIARNLKSKKYGVSHIRFTHATNSVLHASTKIDDTIRYLSLHDNKYLRYFQGHTNQVTGLSMSPIEDRFLSVSLDKTLRLWDLRSPNCQGMMHLQEKSVASIDPEGLIFAVLVNGDSVKLYDLKSFDKGPFSTFRLPMDSCMVEWTSLKFSPDGKQMLLTKTGDPVIRILDAFEGKPLHTLKGHKNTQKNLNLEASYTPDSKYVISGSEDGKIHFWNADTGYEICRLDGGHPRPIQCLQFNPMYMMMASACTNMAFWIPRIEPDY